LARIGLPEAQREAQMRLTMKERRAVTQALVERYRKAGKKQKGRILDEFTALDFLSPLLCGVSARQTRQQVRIGRVRLLAPLRVKPLACRGPDATAPMCSKCSSRFGALWIKRVMRWASSCVRSARLAVWQHGPQPGGFAALNPPYPVAPAAPSICADIWGALN